MGIWVGVLGESWMEDYVNDGWMVEWIEQFFYFCCPV